MIFDDTMSFDAHLSYVCKSSFYHPRNISKIRKYLNKESAATIVHAFITSKLDYYLAKLDCYLAKLDCYLTKLDCYLTKLDCYLAKLDCYLTKLDCYLAKLGCYLAKLDCYLACLSISHGGCIMSRMLQPEWCAKDVNTIILHQCYRNSIGCLSTRKLYSRFSYCIKILHRTIKEKNSSVYSRTISITYIVIQLNILYVLYVF